MAITLLSPDTAKSQLLIQAIESIRFLPSTMFKARGKFDGKSRIKLQPLNPTQVLLAEHWKYFFVGAATQKFVAVVSYVRSGGDSVIFDVETKEGEIGLEFDAFVHTIPYLPKLDKSLRTAFQNSVMDFPRENRTDFDALHSFLEKDNLDFVLSSEMFNIADRITQSVGDSYLRYSEANVPFNALVIGDKKDLAYMAAKLTNIGCNVLALNIYGDLGALPTVSKAVTVDSSFLKPIEDELKANGIRPLDKSINFDDACYFTEHCTVYADALLTQCPILTPRILLATPPAASLYVPKLKSPIQQVIVLNGHAISDLELLAVLSTQIHCRRLSIYVDDNEDPREFPVFQNKYFKPQSASQWFAQ